MNIYDIMKKDNVRLCYGNKWMVWFDSTWIVFQRKYKAKKAIALYRGNEENIAYEILLNA